MYTASNTFSPITATIVRTMIKLCCRERNHRIGSLPPSKSEALSTR